MLKHIAGVSVGIAVATGILFAAKETVTQPQAALPSFQATHVSEVTVPKNVSDAAGMVIDTAKSLGDMSRAADLIVVATVTDQKQYSPVAVASTLSVSRIIKGKDLNTIVVFQGGVVDRMDDEQLKPGETYFLFLGKQTDSAANTFYVKGGHQGVFKNSQGRISGHEERFVSEVAVAPGVDPFVALEHHVKAALR